MFEILTMLLGVLFSGSKKDEKPLITPVTLTFIPPPEPPPAGEPPPPRAPMPGVKWEDAEGEIRVEAMAASPRFPAAPAGYDRQVLAVLVDHDGRANLGKLRVLCDAYVEDIGQQANVVNLNMAVAKGATAKPKILPDWRTNTCFGERLVRKFRGEHGSYIGAKTYEAAFPLDCQIPTTPNVPFFTSDHCKTYDVVDNSVAADWRETLQNWGVDTSERFYWLFDVATCGAQGKAYPMRKSSKDGTEYARIYNLRLEGRGGEVILTAEIARLPVTQILKWRAYWTLTGGAG